MFRRKKEEKIGMFLNNYPTMLPVAGFELSIFRKGAVCSATVLIGHNCIFDKLDFFKKKKRKKKIGMFLNNYPAMLPVEGFEPSILITGAVCSTTVLLGLNSICDKLDFFIKEKNKEKNSHVFEQLSCHATSGRIRTLILNKRSCVFCHCTTRA